MIHEPVCRVLSDFSEISLRIGSSLNFWDGSLTRQRLLLACQSTWISNENSNHPPSNHMRSHSYKLNFKRPDTFICLMRSLFRDKKILPKIPKNEKKQWVIFFDKTDFVKPAAAIIINIGDECEVWHLLIFLKFDEIIWHKRAELSRNNRSKLILTEILSYIFYFKFKVFIHLFLKVLLTLEMSSYMIISKNWEIKNK